jgi:hypothetical protein
LNAKIKRKVSISRNPRRPETLEAFAKAIEERLGKDRMMDLIALCKGKKGGAINGATTQNRRLPESCRAGQ